MADDGAGKSGRRQRGAEGIRKMACKKTGYKILAGAFSVTLALYAVCAGAQIPQTPAPASAPVAAVAPPVLPGALPQGQPAAAPEAPSSAAGKGVDPMEDEQMHVSIEQSFQYRARMEKPAINPEEIGTLFFTLWQHSLLQEAKRGFTTRRPSASDV